MARRKTKIKIHRKTGGRHRMLEEAKDDGKKKAGWNLRRDLYNTEACSQEEAVLTALYPLIVLLTLQPLPLWSGLSWISFIFFGLWPAVYKLAVSLSLLPTHGARLASEPAFLLLYFTSRFPSLLLSSPLLALLLCAVPLV